MAIMQGEQHLAASVADVLLTLPRQDAIRQEIGQAGDAVDALAAGPFFGSLFGGLRLIHGTPPAAKC